MYSMYALDCIFNKKSLNTFNGPSTGECNSEQNPAPAPAELKVREPVKSTAYLDAP